MTIDFDYQVPRLGVGPGPADGSRMCGMQVISWENGDTAITDLPSCSDPMLGYIVQGINDDICTHTIGGLLCPSCSVEVLDLAHRTVGTGDLALTDLERRRVWARVAADLARQVLHLDGKNRAVAETAIIAAERWADEPTQENADTAYDAARTAANAYARAATYAARTAYAAVAYAAARAATYAASAAYAAADAASAAYDDDTARLRLAHRAIDVFEQWTGQQVTANAVENMLEVTQ